MNFLESYYKRIVKQDLTNKFLFTNNKEIPKLKNNFKFWMQEFINSKICNHYVSSRNNFFKKRSNYGNEKT